MSSIIFTPFSMFLFTKYLYNFKFFCNSFLFFSSFLKLDNQLSITNFLVFIVINCRKTFLKSKNLIKKPTLFNGKLLSTFFHLNFYSKKNEFYNNYYELQGFNTVENWWSPKFLSTLRWNQLFFIAFYSSSLKSFKYFYNNYFYIKSKIFFHHNFPLFTDMNTSFHVIDEIFNFDTFSSNFLNLPTKTSVNLLTTSWQLDFLEWIKNSDISIHKKKNSTSKSNFNFYSSNSLTSNFSYFNTDQKLLKQNFFTIKQRGWILYNKFFLISQDIILRKIQYFRNTFIHEKYVLKRQFYFVYWQKFLVLKLKPFTFFQSFFKKNFTTHFFKTLPKTYYEASLNIQHKNDWDVFTETAVHYYSYSSAPFLTTMSGFFFLNASKKFNDISLNLVSSLKSKIYSFFEKFDLHKLIVKNVTKSSFVNTFSPFYSASLTLNSPELTSTLFKYHLINQDVLPNFSSNLIYENFYLNKKLSWILHFYNNLIVENTDKVNLKIQRIKFKPGYMTYWRNARKELKNILNLKFRYQFNLSRYLARYNKHNQYLTFLTSEMFISTILLNSKILPYRHIASDFVRNHFIYINGWCVTRENFQLYKNDFVQILIHLKYYMYYKYLLNLLIQDKLYVKKIVFYKNQHILTQKQKPSSYPNKLKKKFYIENDVPKYLEVDFFSLSIYVLYDPFLVQDFTLEQHSLNRFSILRLYNWKYIT